MMRLLDLVIIIIAFGMKSTISSLPSSELPSDTKRAFDFLDNLLQPAGGCNGSRYEVADIGFGGGFASQFQMAASNWIRAAAAFDYTIPVIVQGSIHGYTTTEECKHVNHSFTCVLLPMSSCEDELLASGVRVGADPIRFNSEFNASFVPAEFASLGINWWWGIVQSRMFRIQPSVEKHIEQKIQYLKEIDGYGFPFSRSVAGMHVRHGDKSSDGFRDHTLSSEIMTIFKSPECIDKTTCLGKLNHQNLSTSDETEGLAMNRNASGHLAVFVASDDRKVLSVSKKLGFLCFSEGVSQNSSAKGDQIKFAVFEKRMKLCVIFVIFCMQLFNFIFEILYSS